VYFLGLNCGFGSSDQVGHLLRSNRGRVRTAMGFAHDGLAGCIRWHSADVVAVTAAPANKTQGRWSGHGHAGVALFGADRLLQPILFADPVAGVIGACQRRLASALDGCHRCDRQGDGKHWARRAADIPRLSGQPSASAAYERRARISAPLYGAGPARRWSVSLSRGRGIALHFDLPAYGLLPFARCGRGAGRMDAALHLC